MKLVVATLRIYGESAVVAGRAFGRSAIAFLLLLAFFPVLWGASLVLSPFGIVGGILVSLLSAACAGTYLATLLDALTVRRSVSLEMVKRNLSQYTGDVLSVLFPLWILSMLLGFLQVPLLPLAITVVVSVLFNPAPEMIGRSRSRGLDLLGDAAKFMGANWPEWLLPQLVVLLPAALLLPGAALGLAGLFGPSFGFVQAGSLVLSGGYGPLGWAYGLAVVAFVHLFMLFRGALYERLASGGRRARAWQENFR